MIIALTGLAGSGKSTAADYLALIGFERVKFAGGLKEMVRALYQFQGLGSAMIERKIEGDLKETPCLYLEGRTPREAMQTLGTEWGRDIMGSDIWVNAAKRKIQMLDKAGRDVVVDDMRFVNESQFIEGCGGVTVRLEGHRERKESAHESETLVSSLPVQYVYSNTASIEEMEDWFNDLVSGHLNEQAADEARKAS